MMPQLVRFDKAIRESNFITLEWYIKVAQIVHCLSSVSRAIVYGIGFSFQTSKKKSRMCFALLICCEILHTVLRS